MTRKVTAALIRKTAHALAAEHKCVTMQAIANRLRVCRATVSSVADGVLGLRYELEILDNRIVKYPRICEVEWIALPWLAQQLADHRRAHAP